MFTNIQQARATWISERLDVLSDAHVLVSSVDQEAGAAVRDCLDSVMRLDSATRDSLCRDHVFSRWVDELRHIALDLASSPSGSPRPGRITSVVGLMRLAVSMLAGTEFECLLVPPLPRTLLLPVSGLYGIVPSFPSDDGLVDCRYRPDRGGVIVGDVALALSSFSSAKSIRVVDKHFECFAESLPGEGYSIACDDAIDSSEWVVALDGAVEMIRSDDVASDLVGGFVSYVVPLQQKETTTNLSFSARNLPNVVFKNNELAPFLVGETLVHEADHQLFYAIEGCVDFWTSDVSRQAAIHLSPWRDDPRPLDGILRGLSSFARVSAYYSNVLRAVVASPQEREAIGSMLLRRLRESDNAMVTVSESGQLSEFGHTYVEEIRSTLSDADGISKGFPHYDRWRAAADSGITDHRSRWQRNHGGRHE